MYLFGGGGSSSSSSSKSTDDHNKTASSDGMAAPIPPPSTMPPSMTPRQQRFVSYEEGGYQKVLAEIDASLITALPREGVPYRTHDLSFKSSATPVRYLFELPVPVDVPGSHVTYRFATEDYDISFGVFFQGANGHLETVLPTTRVDSQYEPISGSVHVHRPGNVILLWDNSYSWWANKQLSYSVDLHHPTGPAFERERMQKAREVLDGAYADIKQASTKQAAVKQERGALSHEVGRLEEQMALLQMTLEEKRRELHTLEEDEVLLDATLSTRKSHVLPLLFRSLPVNVLLHLFGFLDTARDGPHVAATNKLFLHLLLQSRPGYKRPASLSQSLTNSPMVSLEEEDYSSGVGVKK